MSKKAKKPKPVKRVVKKSRKVSKRKIGKKRATGWDWEFLSA